MNHYVDNDVLLKLCVLDLVDEMREVLVTDGKLALVLATARYSIPKRAKKYGAESVTRVTEFLSWATPVTAAPDASDQLSLDIEGIDQGEAQLFSYASRDEGSVLVTGDKRSLEALASSPQCRQIADRLSGRVLCFESVICRMLERCDFASLRQKVVIGMSCDTALRSVFGSGQKAELPTVREALNSYVEDLRSKTSELLGR